MKKILDEREKMQRQQHRRLIITEALMFLAVLMLVVFLTLVVMGYSFNLREIGGSGEVVERSGLVQISSLPTGATIYIDGEAPLLLSTNASRTMLSGEHEISLEREGFLGWKKTVKVVEGMMYRLNYPRLFKEERETEEVMTLGKEVSFVSVSPNNERMVVLMEGVLYVANLNENEPKLKELEIAGADGNVVKITTFVEPEWSGNSEKLLAKVNGEWAVVNVRAPKETVWLGAVLAERGVRDIKFENEAGDRLLVLNDKKELLELDARDKTFGEVLATEVERFDNDGDRVVYLAPAEFKVTTKRTVEEEETVEMVEGYGVYGYRVGDKEGHVLTKVEGEKDRVRLATMRYFQESYVGVYDGGYGGGRFRVLVKTGWVSEEQGMAEVFAEKVEFETVSVKKRGKGMVFELAGTAEGGSVESQVFDIEAMSLVKVDAKNTGWVDEYLRYRLKDGKLSVMDYDGLNERVLVESGVLKGRVVAISGNNRWLYYFVKDKDGEKLVREKIN